MGRVVAGLIVIAMLGGCSTYQQSRSVTIGSALVTLAGSVAIGAGLVAHEVDTGDCVSAACEFGNGVLVTGLVVTPLALIVTISGLVGMGVLDDPPPAKTE